MRERRRGLDDDARVFLRGPHARRRDARGLRPRSGRPALRGGQQHPLRRAGAVDRRMRSAVDAGVCRRAIAAAHRLPAALVDETTRSRPPISGLYATAQDRGPQAATGPPRAPATPRGRRCRCGNNRQAPPCPIRLDLRNDKNQSDTSITRNWIILNQRVRRALHRAGPAELAQHAAHQRGLAGAQVAAQRTPPCRLRARAASAAPTALGRGRIGQMPVVVTIGVERQAIPSGITSLR